LGTSTPGSRLSVAGPIFVGGAGTSSFQTGIITSTLHATSGIAISGGSLLITSTATSTWSGGLTTVGLATSNGLTITGGSINSTATATSTWAGGLNITGGCFAINGVCQNGAAGSGTVNSGTANFVAYYGSTGTAVDSASALSWVNSTSRLGIGTSTPSVNLSVQGNGLFSGNINMASLTATGTVILATGTGSPLVGVGTDTPWGLFSVEAVKGTVNNNTPIFVVGDQGTSTPFLLVHGGNGNVGIGSSTPWAQLSINNLAGATVPLFAVATSTQFQQGTTTTVFVIDSNGRVGIGGTTSPSEALTVSGSISNILSSSTPPVLKGTSAITVSGPQSVQVVGRRIYVVSKAGARIDMFNYATSSPSWMGAVSTSGAAPEQIFVAGKYAYVVTSTGNTFEIYDISNPATSTRTTSFSLAALSGSKSLYVSGRYAYVVNATASTLVVLDISDPFNVSQAASVATNASPQFIYVSGSYAYVTTDYTDDTLQIFDIRNPLNPVSIGSLALTAGNNPEGVYVSGRYAYIANTLGLLQIVDVSNPYGPSAVATIPTQGAAYGVQVSGRYAYVSTGRILQVFDVTNPAVPVSLGGATISSGVATVTGLSVAGRYAYVVDSGANNLYVYDIGGIETTSALVHSLEAGNLQVRNDFTAYGNLSITGGVNIGQGGIISSGPISVLGTTTVPSFISASFGNRVGVGSTSPWGLLSVEAIQGIVSTATPMFVVADSGTSTPFLIVSGANGNVGIGSTTPWAQLSINNQLGATIPLFAVSTSTAVASGFSTPFLISAAGRVGIGGTTTPSEALTVQGNIANLASSSTPPRFMTSFSVASRPRGIYVSGRNIYIISHTDNVLQIFDYSTSSPAHLGTAPLSGATGHAVTVAGRYAYVTSRSHETLSVVDISNSARPTTTISTTLSTGAAATTSVAVSGKFAYVINSSDDTLKMVDIATTTPYVIAPANTLNSPQDVFVFGRYAYVVTGLAADATDALQVFDLSTSTPILAGTLTLAGGVASPSAVYVSGRYAYITNIANNTLQIVNVANPNAPVSLSTITTDNHPTDVFVTGRYAYVTSGMTNTLQVYDVSDSQNPRRVGVVSTGTAGARPSALHVAGRYAYVANRGTSEIAIFDIGGLETTSAIIHSLEVGSLQVRNDLIVQGNLQVTTGLNVGNGGILSHGPISVMATGTLPGFVSAFFGNNVGIGTSTPAGRLSIDNNGASFPAVMIKASGVGAGNVAISVDADDTCVDSSAAAACALNDVAELFGVSEPVNAAELVMFDSANPGKLKKASLATTGSRNLLAGIISTSPAIVFEGSGLKAMGGVYAFGNDKAPLALAGRVPVRVNLEGGPIAVGDPITISSVAGVGSRATSSGKIVGYALNDYKASDVSSGDKILVLIQGGYWISDTLLDLFNTPRVAVEVVASVKNWLAELNIVFENGLIKVKEIIVEVLTANKIVTKQFTTDRIQIADQSTGFVYCVRILNGEWLKTKGDCVGTAPDESSSIATSTPAEVPADVSEDVVSDDSAATSTPTDLESIETSQASSSAPTLESEIATSTLDADASVELIDEPVASPTASSSVEAEIQSDSGSSTTTPIIVDDIFADENSTTTDAQ